MDNLLVIKEELEKVLAKEDCSLYDLSYDTSTKEHLLTVLFDKEGGVDLDLCEKITDLVSKTLDKLDLIKEAYMLEVASAGVERPINNIDQFKQALDKYILVHTKKLYEGYDELVGYLREVNDSYIVLEIKIKTRVLKVNIELENIYDAMTYANTNSL